jgi:hypothetical protein
MKPECDTHRILSPSNLLTSDVLTNVVASPDSNPVKNQPLLYPLAAVVSPVDTRLDYDDHRFIDLS